jgi:5-methylcytosine-specific restriction endonuclease McrA
VINFVKKYQRFIPLSKATIERVSFDNSAMTQGQTLYGVEYQQGALYQRKLRDFIFAKHGKTCVYCNGTSGDKKVEVEHIISKSKGGTNSTHNLAPSCRACNVKKGALSLKEFGRVMQKDYSHLEPKATPKHAAIIQSARNYTIEAIAKLMEVETGEGWETSFNRTQRALPKEHYYDALCVGSKSDYAIATSEVLEVKAQGRGSRQMCRMDRFGFPRTKAKESKTVKGFQTGDIVKAVVPSGLKKGKHLGRVAIRENGYFNITTKDSTVQGINHRHCKIIQKGDGYGYEYKTVSA